MSQSILKLIRQAKQEKWTTLEFLVDSIDEEVFEELSLLSHIEELCIYIQGDHGNFFNKKNEVRFSGTINRYSLPSTLKRLQNLKKLTITGYYFHESGTTTPHHTEKEEYKEFIHSSIAQIKDISVLKELKNLVYLDLSNNIIEDVEPLGGLKFLETLILKNNNLSNVESLKKLKSLLKLDLGNYINPTENIIFTEGNNLETDSNIYFRKHNRFNHIKDISFVRNLNRLQKLNLAWNPIYTMTHFIHLIKKNIPILINNRDENGINLHGCPIEAPPREIIQRGNEAVLRYFNELEKGKIPNDTLKLILLGNTTAGKTSLIKYLMYEEFSSKQNSTHGMEITLWQPQELKGININVWDFGGQEYYHATHRLFLSNNAVYILLWDKTTDRTGTKPIYIYIEGLEKRQKRHYDIFPYEYWLESIRHYAKDSEIFVVQNKSRYRFPMAEDVRLRYGLERDKEFHICLQKADACRAQPEEDVDGWWSGYGQFRRKLLHTLRESVSKYDLVSYWVPIREAILAREENYLDLAHFKEICQAAAGDEVEIAFDLLMIYLRDIASVILYYEEDEDLNDTVFIKPNWLNQNIYNILNYKVLDDEGEFDDAHVVRVVGASQARQFVALMKQFGLIFDLPDAEGRYVAPQYLPKSCSNEIALNLFLKSAKPQHAFTLHFPKFLPKSVMTRFLATYGSKTQNHLFWKYGICFFEEETGVYATYEYEENKIRVEVQDGSKRVAGLVFQTLYQIIQNDEFEVILEGRSPMLWRDLLRDSGRLNPALVRAYQHLMKPPESENEITPIMKKIFISYSHEDMAYKNKFEKAFDVQRRMGKVEIWNDQQIKAGEKWQDKIMDNLESADIIVLLLSSDFLASNFVWDKEFPVIKRRYEADEAQVVPILLRPCDWTALEYAETQIIPSENGKLIPISQWDDSDAAFQKVVEEIKQLL